jgi:GH18 family chitinase
MVTYDTKEVAIQKSEFVRDWNLGGAMWWESSGDKAGADSLIGTVSKLLSVHHPDEQAVHNLKPKLTMLWHRFTTLCNDVEMELSTKRTCCAILRASTIT